MTAGLFRERLLNVAATVATVCALGAVWLRVHESRAPGEPAPRRIPTWVRYAAVGQRTGPASAPVTIVEFSDFQCPICRRASRYLDSLVSHHPNDLLFVYRHLPIHEYSSAAAVASECAGRQGRFRELASLFFQHPEAVGTRSWVEFANEAGVEDTSLFKACSASREARAAVTRDSLAARELNAVGTPTFLINDLEISGFLGDSIMNRIVGAAFASSAPSAGR